MQTAEIVAEACKLDWSSRLEIAQIILQTLEPRDEEIDQLWKEEAQRRLAAHRSSNVLEPRDLAVPLERLYGIRAPGLPIEAEKEEGRKKK